jgi:predicted Zn-dependent protease
MIAAMRSAAVLVASALVVVITAGAAQGKKKKPGLFDIGGWKLPVDQQRDAVKQLAPGALNVHPGSAAAGDMRSIRIRIYADPDYRSTVLHWQQKVRAQIERVNRVVQPVFNLRFQIDSVREWDRSHVGIALDPILAELRALDPAGDVDWVLGLVTPFRGLATSIHQIGGAHLLSRHLVLRAMDDEQEWLGLGREFHLLSEAERRRLYADRKAHKEVVVFLHEWGHTMGLLHHEDPAVIMNPHYDAKQTVFTDFERDVIALVVGRRLADRSQPCPEGGDLLGLVRKSPADEGSDKDRASLLALLQHCMTQKRAAEDVALGAVPLDISAAEVAVFNRSLAAVNAGKGGEAWALLAPLVAKYPRQKAVTGLACHLVAGQPQAQEARAACDSAAKLAPGDPRPLMDAATTYHRAGDLDRAAPLLAAALGRAGADGKTEGKVWLKLGGLASAMGALTAAEAALAHLRVDDPAAAKVAAEVNLTRRRVALPREGGANIAVPPEQEPLYLAAFRDTAEVIASGDRAAARARLTEFRATYPKAAGGDVLGCDLELRGRRPAIAARQCEAALAKFGEASRAHYLLGFMAARARRTAAAEKHLRQAIALDPTQPGGWQELAGMYRVARDRERLARLESEHHARFGTPLP